MGPADFAGWTQALLDGRRLYVFGNVSDEAGGRNPH